MCCELQVKTDLEIYGSIIGVWNFHEIDDDHDDHEHDHDHDDHDDDYNDDDDDNDDDRRLGVKAGTKWRLPNREYKHSAHAPHVTTRHDTTDQWRDPFWWLGRF